MVAGTGLPGATGRTGPSAQLAAEGFAIITYDHRGTGGSDKPDMDYSTRMLAADAAGLLQALDIPPARVLGHSMGGRAAQWLALDHPERVRSLVLAAASPGEIDPRSPVTREDHAYQALINSVPLKTGTHSSFYNGGKRWLNQLKP